MTQDHEAMLSLLEPADSMLDLGCGTGELTQLWASKVNPHRTIGVDTIGTTDDFDIVHANLNAELPFQDGEFNCVISHYSLEHLYNTELFIAEIYRVLQEDGYTVIATDNLSSWPNIASLLLGYQTFSTPITIQGRVVGNPFALRTTIGNVHDSELDTAWRSDSEFTHNKVLAYRTLIDAYRACGFTVEKVIGIGYFPFGGTTSKILATIDVRHAHFLILKARKRSEK
jgi:SAM-dependent methyltransferase